MLPDLITPSQRLARFSPRRPRRWHLPLLLLAAVIVAYVGVRR